ncbi:MAG: hypothetical protein GY942_26850 [Aestuariibacter sp.]|nr:hypothetical protein [Halieaceae bacterium]MCP5013603.1 hypothetical protein [Aestuariibacter sp.]
MAKKVPAPKAKNKVADKGEKDLATLHPDQTITLAGRKLTVREYGFVEGLQLRGLTQPIIDALYEAVADRGDPPELEEILGILSAFSDTLVQLMAISADVDEDWVHQLTQGDGYTLMMVWWSVNGPFFIRRVFNRKTAKLAVERLRAGQTSTPP